MNLKALAGQTVKNSKGFIVGALIGVLTSIGVPSFIATPTANIGANMLENALVTPENGACKGDITKQ